MLAFVRSKRKEQSFHVHRKRKDRKSKIFYEVTLKSSLFLQNSREADCQTKRKEYDNFFLLLTRYG